jgi:hypothetical protein
VLFDSVHGDRRFLHSQVDTIVPFGARILVRYASMSLYKRTRSTKTAISCFPVLSFLSDYSLDPFKTVLALFERDLDERTRLYNSLAGPSRSLHIMAPNTYILCLGKTKMAFVLYLVKFYIRVDDWGKVRIGYMGD